MRPTKLNHLLETLTWVERLVETDVRYPEALHHLDLIKDQIKILGDLKNKKQLDQPGWNDADEDEESRALDGTARLAALMRGDASAQYGLSPSDLDLARSNIDEIKAGFETLYRADSAAFERLRRVVSPARKAFDRACGLAEALSGILEGSRRSEAREASKDLFDQIQKFRKSIRLPRTPLL